MTLATIGGLLLATAMAIVAVVQAATRRVSKGARAEAWILATAVATAMLAVVTKQDFGLYNALAVMAYLLRSISGHSEWAGRLREIVDGFPSVPFLVIDSMGFAEGWDQHELWSPA